MSMWELHCRSEHTPKAAELCMLTCIVQLPFIFSRARLTAWKKKMLVGQQRWESDV